MAEETQEEVTFIENPDAVIRQEALEEEIASLTATEDAEEEPEAEDEAASEADPEDGETSQDGTSSKPKGDDEILQQLDETDPDAAARMRALITDAKNTRLEAKDIEKLVDQKVEEKTQAIRKEETEEEKKDREARESDIEYLRKLAKEAGLVLQEDVQKSEADKFVDSMNQAAIDAYGDVFGTFEQGEFQLNPDQQEPLSETFDRLMDPKRGIALADLYRITNHDTIVEAAKDEAYKRGLEEGRNGRASRQEARKKAATENSSAAGPSTAENFQLRGKEGDKDSDSSPNVMMRAFLQAKKQLGQ
jgi:phosphatidate phosphatase PAH1